MKGSGQKKEAAELREKLEGMIENQEGADVSEAVQLFRTFVLKFCGGKGGDSKPPSDEGGVNEDDESEWSTKADKCRNKLNQKWLQEFFGAPFLKAKLVSREFVFLSLVIVEVLCHFRQRL